MVLADATMVFAVDFQAILGASELPIMGLTAILDEYEGAEDTRDLQDKFEDQWDEAGPSLGTDADDVEVVLSIAIQGAGYFVIKGGFDFGDIEGELEARDFDEDTYRGHRIWEHERGESVALFHESGIYIYGEEDVVKDVLRAIARDEGFMEDEAELRRALESVGDGLVRLAMDCDELGVHFPGSMSGLVGRLDESCEGVAVVVSSGYEDRTELVIGYVYGSEQRAESAAEALDESIRDSGEIGAEIDEIGVDGDIVIVKLRVYGESSGRSLAEAPTEGPASPVSKDLSAGAGGLLAHESGARIEVPRGATAERVTVSIAEVAPPKSSLAVVRAFDFSVGGVDLEGPVTVHIPFELEPGQDASSVHALHWDDETVGWEPVPGVVDESAGTIAVTTDRLSIFSWLWVKVEASCVTDRGVLGAGEALTVISTVTSSTLLPVDVYMTPSLNRVGDAVGGGSLGRTEVGTVGLGRRAELAYEVVPTAPGGYRVQCRIFWVTNRAGTEMVSKELESESAPSAVVTVKRDRGPAAGAHLRIEEIGDEYPTIYTGKSYSILVDVGNAGDERSGRFDLVADFTSAADGQTTRLHHSFFDPDSPRYGREDEVDPGSVDKRRISVEVPGGLVPGEYRICVGIAHADGSEVDPDAGACLDRYVLSLSEGAMVVTVSPVDTLGGRRAWAALPEKVSIEVLRKAIEFAEIKDDETLKTVYKRVAGELAFRKAVAPGPERRHILLHGLKEKVDDPLEIGGYITDVCLDSGIDCGKALDRFGLTVQDSGILTKFPTVPNEAVSFLGQSVSGTLLFYDVYYTMLVNQALDLDQALDTLDGLEKLPLGDVWKEAVAEARNEVAVTASPDKWTQYAAGIVQDRGDILQFAGVQAVKGLVHAAAKRQLLHHAGIAGQKALVPALGLKPVGGTVAGAGGLAAAGPAAFVASVWFASEVYRNVEAQEEQLGIAALAAFINAAFSDPEFIEREFSDPDERANLQEAMAYAKYMAYDNLHKAEDGWLNSLWAHLKLYAADRHQFLEEMEDGRAEALEELMVLLSPESVEVDPGTLALAAGESGKLRARVTARSGRVVSHSGFEWTSRSLGTATVSEDGVVTGVAPGEAVIAVRAGDVEASARVEVAAAADAGAFRGGLIAFASDREGNRNIYVMNAGGSGLTRLTDNSSHDWNPIWSPNDRRIMYQSYRNRLGDWGIHVVNADGSEQTQLMNHSSDWEPRELSWSPDGQRIAFVAYLDVFRDEDSASFGDVNLYVMNADGTGLTSLTDTSTQEFHASWSPVDQRIMFTSFEPGEGEELYVANADGSSITQLTDISEWDDSFSAPVWSPDGRRVMFDSNSDGSYDIFAMNSDGSDLTRLTTKNILDDNYVRRNSSTPAWSPDGKRIAFVSAHDMHYELSTMNADGSNQVQLTDDHASVRDPVWSPDGQHIAFSSSRDGDSEIFIVNQDGSGLTQLTHNEVWDGFPRWSPTGVSSSDRFVPLTTWTPSVAAEPRTAGYTEDFFGTLDSDHWLLYGTAEHLQSDGVIQLTIAQRDQLGFLLMRQPISLEGLKIEFSFEIGGGSGADGLGLLLLRSMPDFSQINPSHHAGGGWGSRYLEGYLVAFDTHLNRAGYFTRGGGRWYNPINDPSGNFVALAELGAGGEGFDIAHLVTEHLSVDLRDSGPFDVEVVFGENGHVKVYLSNAESGMNRTLVIDHIIHNFDPFNAYIGFIGATGGATDRHIIRSVRYELAH